MSWNYRVARFNRTDPILVICEVFYDAAGAINGWSEAGSPCGETLDEMRSDIALMLGALEKPVLDQKELPRP